MAASSSSSPGRGRSRTAIAASAPALLLLAAAAASACAPAHALPRPPAAGAGPTALDEYVAAPDDAFAWRLLSSREVRPLSSLGPSVTSHHISMTSQRWLNGTATSCSVWTHDVVVTVPRAAAATSALGVLFIGSGDVGISEDEVYAIPETMAAQAFAAATDLVTVAVNQVPNQSCTYAGDPKREARAEDANVAYTFRVFFEQHAAGDPREASRWPIYLPAVKSAVRAMDAAGDFLAGGCPGATVGAGDCAALRFPSAEDARWLVTGASKRGWTTWCVQRIRVPGARPAGARPAAPAGA